MCKSGSSFTFQTWSVRVAPSGKSVWPRSQCTCYELDCPEISEVCRPPQRQQSGHSHLLRRLQANIPVCDGAIGKTNANSFKI